MKVLADEAEMATCFGSTIQLNPGLVRGGRDTRSPSWYWHYLVPGTWRWPSHCLQTSLSHPWLFHSTCCGWNHIVAYRNHVIDANGGRIDNTGIHFAKAKNSSGDQVLNTAQSIHSDPHHHVSGKQLAWQYAAFCWIWMSKEPRTEIL